MKKKDTKYIAISLAIDDELIKIMNKKFINKSRFINHVIKKYMKEGKIKK